jgi:hypothetical protein
MAAVIQMFILLTVGGQNEGDVAVECGLHLQARPAKDLTKCYQEKAYAR